ncbi:amidohydrolase family protein [Ferruginibacter paludis]|uniref:amidohydrolase family protein n=1 Tax=Ferruginibacter paludis TaxID=1310417 RepID=UPI0025B38B9D|nr:amidohydrolase family protein [Ferruginibacter paludis]MDN3654753.1 amidohydrolase family protein [Ferruginibacter paludis]
MKKILLPIALLFSVAMMAQENMHPSPAQTGTIALTNGIIHIGNGQVIENGMIVFSNGKIKDVRATAPIADVKVIDLKGKHVYPGVIAASTNLGLVEVSAVRSTADYDEVGDINPSIRSLVAYNTDSKVINTLRSNGVLLAHVVPQGGTISGTSSVVQLDAWNWEDAAYKADNGIHFNMPSLVAVPAQFRRPGDEDRVKQSLEKIERIRAFFREAKAYHNQAPHVQVNLKLEAVQGLFDKSKTFFVHCNLVKEMMMAISMAKEFDFKLVLVGASDSWLMTDMLKENNVAVILSEPHSLPATDDDDVDQPYKTGAALQRAGVLFTICQEAEFGFWRQRNLPFEAGTMAAYGLTKEQALTAITLSAAKILGIDNITGSLETGKDANIVISEGDLLDMKSSKVTQAFIQGREINLDNKQKQLFERYKYKYSIK